MWCTKHLLYHEFCRLGIQGVLTLIQMCGAEAGEAESLNFSVVEPASVFSFGSCKYRLHQISLAGPEQKQQLRAHQWMHEAGGPINKVYLRKQAAADLASPNPWRLLPCLSGGWRELPSREISVLLHVDQCIPFLHLGNLVSSQHGCWDSKDMNPERKREWGGGVGREKDRLGEKEAPPGRPCVNIMRHDFQPTLLVGAVTKSNLVSRRRGGTDPPLMGWCPFLEKGIWDWKCLAIFSKYTLSTASFTSS